MKYLKRFERFDKLEDFPRVGNYVLLKPKFYRDDFQDFFTNNVGKLIRIYNIKTPNMEFINVKYERNVIPENIIRFFVNNKNTLEYYRTFDLDEIEFFSKDKSEVEAYIKSKNYNL